MAVVVATYNRCELLDELLDALAAQTYRDFEVVVVDDGSDDATAKVAARADRVLRTRRVGPARARQLGWQSTSAGIVAFTDDDCRPHPGWIEQLVGGLLHSGAGLAQGKTVPRQDQLDRMGPWSRTQWVESESGFYQTCNIAYLRSALQAVGGFHPSFRGPLTSGEDTDLAWRVKEAGFPSVFVPDAVVEHVVWPSSYRAFLRDRRRWGTVVLTLRHHPGLRDLAYRRYFYRPSHARALGAGLVLGIAGLIRPWLPAGMALAVGAAYSFRGPEPSRRAAHLGRVIVADLYEVAVFAAASARYRTLLL